MFNFNDNQWQKVGYIFTFFMVLSSLLSLFLQIRNIYPYFQAIFTFYAVISFIIWTALFAHRR